MYLCKDAKSSKNELHHVISGKSQARFGTIIQTVARYLNDGTQADSEVESTK